MRSSLVWSGLNVTFFKTGIFFLWRLYDIIGIFRYSPHFYIMSMLLRFINLIYHFPGILVSQRIFFIFSLLIFRYFFISLLYSLFQLRIVVTWAYVFPSTYILVIISCDSINKDMMTLLDFPILFCSRFIDISFDTSLFMNSKVDHFICKGFDVIPQYISWFMWAEVSRCCQCCWLVFSV